VSGYIDWDPNARQATLTEFMVKRIEAVCESNDYQPGWKVGDFVWMAIMHFLAHTEKSGHADLDDPVTVVQVIKGPGMGLSVPIKGWKGIDP
jgi:hypothetical protein